MIILETLKEIANEALDLVDKHETKILTGLACCGVVLTGVTAAIFNAKVSEKTTKNYIKANIVPAALAAGTIACIVKNENAHSAKEAALTSALTAATLYSERFQEETRKKVGDETTDYIYERITKLGKPSQEEIRPSVYFDKSKDEGKLYCLLMPDKGYYFVSTPELVQEAKYLTNRTFAIYGEMSERQFLEYFGIFEDVVPNFGWSLTVGPEKYGYQWIDFRDEPIVIDDPDPEYDGIECVVLYLPFEPTDDYEY